MKFPRHAEIWLKPYLADRARSFLRGDSTPLRHIWLTMADHFEPFWKHADSETACRRVKTWSDRWPEIAARTADVIGSVPRYTFFYPTEQYHPRILDALAEMTHDGIADVEVHIHHDGEGREDFIDRISTFCRTLVERHGLLRKTAGQTRFGFIHGNWALDNSLPGGRWCGLNDEITLLRDLGCYADFTMPSGASPSQAAMINTVYWCTDDPHAPKSYNTGTPVRQGNGLAGDLLMIPGPFGFRVKGRLLPRMETGELASYDAPNADRARLWFDLAPRIGEHAFLKLYTHGATESNSNALLGSQLLDLFRLVSAEAHRRGIMIHFVSAWQMYLAIDAIAKGENPLAQSPAEDRRISAGEASHQRLG